MDDTIKVGDVVRLKSGGPAMTVAKIGVDKIGGETGTARASCVWFPTNTLTGEFGAPDTAIFTIETLVRLDYDDDEDDCDSASEDLEDAIDHDAVAAQRNYYVDVGTMSPEQATNFLSGFRNEFGVK